MTTRLILQGLLLTAFVVLAGLAAACGDDDGNGNGASATPAATFAPGSTMASIAQRGKLVVGVKYDVPLFGLLDPATRRVDGFDIGLAKEIAKELGLREDQVELVEAISANRIPFLLEDKVDLVISTMTINAQRKEQIDFSRPYYQAGQSILVRKSENSITGIASLNGKKVCSAQGSTSEQNVAEKAPQAELLSLPAYSSCVSAMKDGRVDAVSTDDIILAGFAASDKDLKLVGGQFTTENYGIGVKKGKTDLVQFIDALLAKMLQDGRWEALYKKYLGEVQGLPASAEAKAKLPSTS
jgi:ABC-type amino acid transport substrate-binding protein